MDSTWLAVMITLGILALAGLFALIEALADRRTWRRREACERARTTGVLVGFAERTHWRGRIEHRNRRLVTVYYPIVRYQVDGVAYKLQSAESVPRAKFQEGQSMDLLYDPYDPTHFHIDRGDLHERSTRSAIVFALVWLTVALAAIAILACIKGL